MSFDQIHTESIVPPAPADSRYPRRVFCNRPLRLDHIEWIGFDMDYTLATYVQHEMDRLSIAATANKLVTRGYPEDLRTVEYDTGFPVRGLLIDRKLGNVLKMDRHRYIKQAFHGTQRLSREERRATYDTMHIRAGTSRYHWVDTLYGLSEVTIYAAAVDVLDQHYRNPEYDKLFADIRECIDQSHQDGSILNHILEDIPRYITLDPELPETLHRFRSHGKRIFLLTNSWPAYTEKVMTYLLDGKRSEYASWKRYFDLVITGSRKPTFFTEKTAFQVWQNEKFSPARELKKGEIYFGGNIFDLQETLGTTGDQVLYVGDHIYGDVLRAKKQSAWRTTMIIQELEDELRVRKESQADYDKLDAFFVDRERLVDDFQVQKERLRRLKRELRGEKQLKVDTLKKQVDAIKKAIADKSQAIETLADEISARFHPLWGSLLKADGEISSFGKQIEDWSGLYTSRVSNFKYYSPAHYFRSPRDLMAHELVF